MEVRFEQNKKPGIILSLVVNTLSVFAVSYVLSGVEVDQMTTAILVAVVLAILNATIKPLLIILTLPLTLMTFGLFLLVINAAVILMASEWIDGFTVNGFWWALLFSFLISVVNSILFSLNK